MATLGEGGRSLVEILEQPWTNGKDGVFVRFPIKTILQIKDDKILRHWDFADYDSYREQIDIQSKQ
jgi:predicted ester cyclase